MSATIHRHPSAPIVAPRVVLGHALDTAARLADGIAQHSGQEPDRLRAELLAAIAADDLARAVAVMAGLSLYTNARSA